MNYGFSEASSRTKIMIILGVLVVLVAGGVVYTRLNGSKAAPVAKNATKSKVCDLFNQAAAGKVLGGPATRVNTSLPDIKTSRTLFSTCIYRIDAKAKNGPRSLSIILRNNSSGDMLKRNFQNLRISSKGVVVNKLGDEAFWVETSNQLNVRKGDSWLSVFVSKPNKGAASEDIAKSVAAELVKKI